MGAAEAIHKDAPHPISLITAASAAVVVVGRPLAGRRAWRRV